MNKFYIDKKVYFHWDDDIKLTYEESFLFIDHEYFSCKYKTLSRQFKNNKDKNKVLKDIVITSGMALESLFSLICSFTQAGYSYYMWINLYRNNDLHSVISKINRKEFINNCLGLKSISWNDIAGFLFNRNEKSKELTEPYSRIWENLAGYYCDAKRQEAYNRVKHGFTASSNAIKEIIIGSLPEQISISGSQYGSHYITAVELKDTKCNFISKEQFVHYDVEYLLEIIRFVSYSIMSIKSIMESCRNAKEKCTVTIVFINKDYMEKFLAYNKLELRNIAVQKRTVSYPNILPLRNK